MLPSPCGCVLRWVHPVYSTTGYLLPSPYGCVLRLKVEYSKQAVKFMLPSPYGCIEIAVQRRIGTGRYVTVPLRVCIEINILENINTMTSVAVPLRVCNAIILMQYQKQMIMGFHPPRVPCIEAIPISWKNSIITGRYPHEITAPVRTPTCIVDIAVPLWETTA
jgi:hypothetical protein